MAWSNDIQRPQLFEPFQFGRHDLGGHENHRRILELLCLAQRSHCSGAIDPRHHDIQHHQIRLKRVGTFHHGFAGLTGHDFEPSHRLERKRRNLTDVRLVFGVKDLF